MHLLVLTWEASQSISEARLNSEIHKQPKCPEWRLQSTQPQTEHVYCNLFLLRLQGYLLRRAWKECTGWRCTLATRKQCVSDTPEQMHKCNPRGWKSTLETRASPRQPNASIDMTVWRETSCLALELLSTPAAARGRDRFFSYRAVPGKGAVLQRKPTYPRIFQQHEFLFSTGQIRSGESWGRGMDVMQTCCMIFSKNY